MITPDLAAPSHAAAPARAAPKGLAPEPGRAFAEFVAGAGEGLAPGEEREAPAEEVEAPALGPAAVIPSPGSAPLVPAEAVAPALVVPEGAVVTAAALGAAAADGAASSPGSAAPREPGDGPSRNGAAPGGAAHPAAAAEAMDPVGAPPAPGAVDGPTVPAERESRVASEPIAFHPAAEPPTADPEQPAASAAPVGGAGETRAGRLMGEQAPAGAVAPPARAAPAVASPNTQPVAAALALASDEGDSPAVPVSRPDAVGVATAPAAVAGPGAPTAPPAPGAGSAAQVPAAEAASAGRGAEPAAEARPLDPSPSEAEGPTPQPSGAPATAAAVEARPPALGAGLGPERLLPVSDAGWRLEASGGGAGAEAPKAPAAARDVAGQITLAVTQATEPRVEIRLDPPELGRVQIRLNPLEGGGLQAVVLADRPETQDFLRRNADTLVRDLADAGFAEVSLEFAAGGERAPQDPRPEERRFAPAFAPAPVFAPVPEPPRRVASGGLDIRL